MERMRNNQRKIIALFCAILSSVIVLGQNSNDKLSLGAMASYDLLISGDLKSTKPVDESMIGNGGSVGTFCRFFPYRNNLFYEGAISLGFGCYPPSELLNETKTKWNYFSLCVPLNIGYKFEVTDVLGFSIMAGFSFSYDVVGKFSSVMKPKIDSSWHSAWRKENVSFQFGFEFMRERFGVCVGANIGLINKVRNQKVIAERRMYENSVSVVAKYIFWTR